MVKYKHILFQKILIKNILYRKKNTAVNSKQKTKNQIFKQIKNYIPNKKYDIITNNKIAINFPIVNSPKQFYQITSKLRQNQ